MSIENYVFPIYREKAEGIDFKGNGFFVGNLFFTAEHVIMPDRHIFYGDPFIIIGNRKVVLTNKVELKYKSLLYDENDCASGHEDEDMTDFVVFKFADVEVNSPLNLATSLPVPGQQLRCDFYHNNKNLCSSQKIMNKFPLTLYYWETEGVVETPKKYFVGNFFGVRMKPSHPHQGSSGSPLYDNNNIVYGILHNGQDDFCGFYSAVHAHKLLKQLPMF